MTSAAANIIELPTAASLRNRLNEAEKDREDMARSILLAARIAAVASQTADGLEEICNAEKARAEQAIAALAAREAQFRAVAGEIEALQREVATLRADAIRQQDAHAMGIAVLRQMLDRRQAELEAAQTRAAALEQQISDIRLERVAEAKRAIRVGMKECARLAALRAEGWGIAEEIRMMMKDLPDA